VREKADMREDKALKSGKKYRISQTDRKKILDRLSTVLESVESVLFAYLHGSFLDGNFNDIDIGVFANEVQVKELMRYELELESLIDDAIKGFPVEIRILNRAPVSFNYHVIKNGMYIFCRDDNKRVDFEMKVMDTYFDFAPFRREYLMEALNLGT
jgi:hypothetical protein